jgi:hypothetical protein
MTFTPTQKPVNTRIGFDEVDLTTPTSLQKYPLGMVLTLEDGSKKTVRKYVYIKAHAALTQYQPYVLDIAATEGAEVATGAPATLAAPGRKVVVPQVAFTSGYYGFVLLEGDGKVLMTAETYAVGDHLQVLNAGTALVVDGTSGATTFSVNSCAICKEAGSDAVARDFWLFERQAVVAAT